MPEEEQGEKIYSLYVEVTDPDTENTVTNTVSKVVHTTDAYVGIQTPYRQTKDQGITVQ